MIKKLIHFFAFGLLACTIYLPGECEHPSPFPFGSGIMQPFAYSPQYDVDEPDARQQLTVDERLRGSSEMPAGGPGLGWTWRF
jgi:hypothetical protein